MTEPHAPRSHRVPSPGGDESPAWGILAIIAAVALVGGVVLAFVLLGGDDEPPQVQISPSASTEVVESPSPGDDPDPLPTRSPIAAEICTTETPKPLIDCVPPTVGEFTLTGWGDAPEFAAAFEAGQAIEVEFNGPDGKRILHYLFAYDTRTEAAIAIGDYADASEEAGFTLVGDKRERGVDVTRLFDEEEILVWSNGRLMAVVQGSFDVATDFFHALPY